MNHMIYFAISLHTHSERRGCPVSGDDRIGSMFPQVHSVLLHSAMLIRLLVKDVVGYLEIWGKVILILKGLINSE